MDGGWGENSLNVTVEICQHAAFLNKFLLYMLASIFWLCFGDVLATFIMVIDAQI